jgi:hypothetical protein
VQLLPGPARIGVLDRAVGLGDRRVLRPQEVDPSDGTVVSPDPDLELGRGSRLVVLPRYSAESAATTAALNGVDMARSVTARATDVTGTPAWSAI